MHALPAALISIHLPILKSRFPDLAALARKGMALDEIGETLARRSRQSSPVVRVAGFGSKKQDDGPAGDWSRVKEALRELFSGQDDEASELFPQSGDGSSSSTLRMLAALSMRISGNLGIPLSRTTPLVAAALHDIAVNGGRGWLEEASV